jgi:hypothetical protein
MVLSSGFAITADEGLDAPARLAPAIAQRTTRAVAGRKCLILDGLIL